MEIDYALTGSTVSFGQKFLEMGNFVTFLKNDRWHVCCFAPFVGCINSAESILGFLSSRC